MIDGENALLDVEKHRFVGRARIYAREKGLPSDEVERLMPASLLSPGGMG